MVGSVTRVVLDTMYVRGAREEELLQLRTRGFAISIPMIVIKELWARSANERRPGLLFRRVQLLSKHVDQAMPLTPDKGALTKFITARDDAEVENHLQWLRGFWMNLVRGQVDDEAWQTVGLRAHEDLEQADWHGLLNSMIGKYPDLAHIPMEDLVSQLRAALYDHEIGRSTARVFDAHQVVKAMRIAQAAVANPRSFKKAVQNDTPDLQLLLQVGLPAFVATEDGRLLGDVDASGTYQAPWIRRLADLVEGDLPDCLPWGIEAHDAASGFSRAP